MRSHYEPLASSLYPYLNTATSPVPKLEDDGYLWFERHHRILCTQKKSNPDYVLMGDSLIHQWEWLSHSTKSVANSTWSDMWGGRKVLNMGFGWDRTQNVLWRLQDGAMEQLSPKAIVLHIGTNNLTGTVNARVNSPEETALGIAKIVEVLNRKAPMSRVILMAIFPRQETESNPRREDIQLVNQLVFEKTKDNSKVSFLNIENRLLDANGELLSKAYRDGTHFTEYGYTIWGDALKEIGIFDHEF